MDKIMMIAITIIYIVGGTIVGGLIATAYSNYEIGMSIIDVLTLVAANSISWAGLALMFLATLAHSLETRNYRQKIDSLEIMLDREMRESRIMQEKLNVELEDQRAIVGWIRKAIDEAVIRDRIKQNSLNHPKDYSDSDDHLSA